MTVTPIGRPIIIKNNSLVCTKNSISLDLAKRKVIATFDTWFWCKRPLIGLQPQGHKVFEKRRRILTEDNGRPHNTVSRVLSESCLIGLLSCISIACQLRSHALTSVDMSNKFTNGRYESNFWWIVLLCNRGVKTAVKNGWKF